MVSKILNAGDKIDIRIYQKEEVEGRIDRSRVYKSVIYDILDNGNLEIAMPTENGKMILLSLGVRYEMVFYTKLGLYRCAAQVKERYKSDNLYMLLMEVRSQISKFQRREYFRFSCTMDMEMMTILEEEAKNILADDIYTAYKEKEPFLIMLPAVAVDLSGGGIRFISSEPGKKNDYLLIKLRLENENINKELKLSGKLLQCNKLDTDIDKYEYRVQFILNDAGTREIIIKYIFDEERKNRKNKGL